MMKLIDISEHNGVADLTKTKKYIDGIIARCSWGWGDDQVDKQWKNNAQQANALSIPLFAYHFCYARNVEEAKKEAVLALRVCKNYNPNVLYYDIEYNEFQGNLSPNVYYDIAKAFCDIVESEGIPVGIYANENYFKTKLINLGFSKWTLWIASYGINDGYDHWNGTLKYNPFNNVLIHQCTSNAKHGLLRNIEGITSDFLDCNIDYGLLKTFNNQILTLDSKVKVKKNSLWYDGKTIPDFVYEIIYDVFEISGDRVVIGIDNKVTGAIQLNRLSIIN